MRRLELIALRAAKLPWDQLTQLLPPTLEALGVVHDAGGADGFITLHDHGDQGRVVHLDDSALARRAALALATKAAEPIKLYEVIATSGGKHFRFRTAAFVATAQGELKPAEGKELDLEDPTVNWGGGELEKQGGRVLEEFALLPLSPARSVRMGYRRKSKGRPSTPRVATLFTSLQKAKSHESVAQPDGRFELRITLAAGGRQSSFCSAAEHAELQKLLGGQ